ncbi:hypothetical protein D3C76_1456020 [compost metagenome]
MTWSTEEVRIFCSQPMFTSCNSGLVARSVATAALVPLKPIMMRSRAWRSMMALVRRTWKSGNLAQASSRLYGKAVSKLVCLQL